MKSPSLPFSFLALFLLVGCAGESDQSHGTNQNEDAVDVQGIAPQDTPATADTSADAGPEPEPGSIESAPSCQDYCQGLMDKLFAPGGTQMEDLECLQQNVGTPPAFDLDCLMGAANPSYEGCLECYTGEETGEATCAALVATCL